MTEKELFIGIWQVPPATDENYKMLADCGINAVFLNGDYSEDIEEQKKAVAYAEKYGIDIVLEGKNKLDGSRFDENPCRDSKAVAAFNLFDEPNYCDMEALTALALKLKKAYPDKTVLFVCHGGVSRMIKTYFEDMTNDEFFHYSPENAYLAEYEL